MPYPRIRYSVDAFIILGNALVWYCIMTVNFRATKRPVLLSKLKNKNWIFNQTVDVHCYKLNQHFCGLTPINVIFLPHFCTAAPSPT